MFDKKVLRRGMELRGRLCEQVAENCKRDFINCKLHPLHWHQIKNERRVEAAIRKPEGMTDHLGDLAVDGITILNINSGNTV